MKRFIEAEAISKQRKAIASKKRRQEKKMDRFQDALEQLEVRLLMKEIDERTHKGIRQRLDAKKTELEASLAQLNFEDKDLTNQRKWIDWVGLHKRQMADLHTMEEPDKTNYLLGIVERIAVHNKTNNAHRIAIKYKLPIVGDAIQYQRTDGKRKGPYDLIDGSVTEVWDNLTLTRVYQRKKTVVSGSYKQSILNETIRHGGIAKTSATKEIEFEDILRSRGVQFCWDTSGQVRGCAFCLFRPNKDHALVRQERY